MWLLKRFRDCNPRIFKGSTDAKEAEVGSGKWKNVLRLRSVLQKLLVEFSLKNEAHIWSESMGRVHARD